MSSVSFFRRLGHWSWRWLSRLFVTAAVGAVILGGAVLWYRPTLTKVSLDAANYFSPEYAVDAALVEQGPGDEWTVKNLKLKNRSDGRELLSLGTLKLRASFDDLRGERLAEVRLEDPALQVTPELLALFSGEKKTSDDSAWRVDKLSVHRGQLSVALPDLPHVQVQIAAQLSDLSTKSTATELQTIRLTNLRVAEAADSTEALLAIPTAEAAFTWSDLQNHRLASLRLDQPQIRLNAALQRYQQTKAATSQPPAPPAPIPWQIGRLQITGAQLAGQKFAAGMPAFSFKLEADLQNVPLGPTATPADEARQALDLKEVTILAPDGSGEPIIRLAGLRTEFTWKELLDQRRIDSVELDQPDVRYDAEIQRLFATPATTPAAPPQKVTAPYVIGSLRVNQGHALLRDLDGSPVSYEFTTDAALSEIPLGSGGEWTDAAQALTIRDLALRTDTTRPFVRVPVIYGTFTWDDLINHRRIGTIRIEEPRLRFDPGVQRALATKEEPAVPRPIPGKFIGPPIPPPPPFRVGELELVGGRVHLADLGMGLPSIDFGLQTTFRDLALSLEGEALGETIQTIELRDIGLQSPADPFTPVLTLRTLFIRFTPAGLWHRRIEHVEILQPVLHIGEDLFWYVDRVQQGQTEAEETPADGGAAAAPSWSVKKLDATDGQLVLAFDGRPRLPLPLPFETHARDLNFERLSELRLTLDLIVPEQDYLYPDYELTLRRVSGRIQFALPPEKRQNNVVQTLKVGHVIWKDYQARDLYLDLTYDEKAIHGEIGGRAYSGYLRGAFDFALDPASTWSGWVAGTKVDLKQVTDVFSPDKFSLSGPATIRTTVSAQAKEIRTFSGDFVGLGPGSLKVGKLDDIIKELPADWAALKRALTKIGLETLRDFDYETAKGDFQFLGTSGKAKLDLRGPNGSRVVDATFHDGPEKKPVSQR